MKSKCYPCLLALAGLVLLAWSGQALARRVNHDVTRANLGKLPFAATVEVKDVGKLKEFTITIQGVQGNLFRPSSPGGWLEIPGEGKAGAPPAVARAENDGAVTFTFRLSAEQVKRARFGFVEDAEDWNRPFPTRGDYYQFILRDFVGNFPD